MEALDHAFICVSRGRDLIGRALPLEINNEIEQSYCETFIPSIQDTGLCFRMNRCLGAHFSKTRKMDIIHETFLDIR